MAYQDGRVSPGEGGKGNKNTHSRKEISRKVGELIYLQGLAKTAKEKNIKHEQLYGRNGERISEVRGIGVQDRINAVPYDPNKYKDEHDKNNYYEGFFNMGNRAIQGQIEMLSDEQLQAIGKNDYVSGVKIESLHESVRANVSYTEGYMMASIFGTEKGKGSR